MRRLFGVVALLCGIATAGTAPAQAVPDANPPDTGPPDAGLPDAAQLEGPGARVTCEHPSVPGRVRCEIEAHPAAGESIAWGDAVLASVPPFATALRGRIGPSDTLERTPERWRWAFALVARERGQGDLTARVRLVICHGTACAARELPVTGRVGVGP